MIVCEESYEKVDFQKAKSVVKYIQKNVQIYSIPIYFFLSHSIVCFVTSDRNNQTLFNDWIFLNK